MPKDKPEIRFAGYTDAWEQCKLSDEMTDFIVPMRDKPKEFGGNIPWTRIEDIEGKFLNDSLSEQYVTEETIQKMNLKIIPKDSLIVSSSATFGVVAVVTQDLITNQTFIGLVPREKNTLDYWYSFFQSSEARKYMKLQSAGSTIFYIARDSFEKMPISVPKIDEMIKIGEYFSNLDNLIALHQRKLDLLKEQKKGYLQKMFPKNGSKVPELRFAGFADDWEKRKLGEITNISTGKLDANAMVDNGKYDFYTSGIKKYKINTPSFEGPAITIAGNGATVGYMHLADNKFNAYQRTYVLQNFLADRNFLFSEIGNKLPKKINQEARNGNIPYIVMDMLTELKLTLPISDTEQQMIGIFLKQLDNLITVNQRRVDLLKQEKKALLQKMFV